MAYSQRETPNAFWQVFFSIRITKVNLNKLLSSPIRAAPATQISPPLNRSPILNEIAHVNYPIPFSKQYRLWQKGTRSYTGTFVHQLQKTDLTYDDGREAGERGCQIKPILPFRRIISRWRCRLLMLRRHTRVCCLTAWLENHIWAINLNLQRERQVPPLHALMGWGVLYHFHFAVWDKWVEKGERRVWLAEWSDAVLFITPWSRALCLKFHSN